MYIRLSEGLGYSYLSQCPPVASSLQPYKPPFASAERDITDSDAPSILRILCGPSPWQPYLRANLNAHLHSLPRQLIRVVNDGSFAQAYRNIFHSSVSADVQGFVDRANAIIYLREFPRGNRAKSKLGLALHEAVHILAHPPGKSKLLVSTGYSFLGRGLLEGLTQMITEDVQRAQGIRPMREGWQAYKNFVPVAREISRIFTPTVIGNAYFNGQLNDLVHRIAERWTLGKFETVKVLTNQEKTNEALQLIRNLEQAYAKRPKIRTFQWVFR